jgi:histidine triad (HIT) family protein
MARDPNCIFCKIVAGHIPCLRVYEDDNALAFLDIGPLADGHLLLIPKDHYERFETMPPDAVAAITRTVPSLARAVLDVTGRNAYNVLVNTGRPAGQEVPHVHFHIIPRQPGDGLGYRWNPKKYDGDRGKQLADAIIRALAS